jgi:hypothetical protein
MDSANVEAVMTEIYNTWAWRSSTSLEKTAALRSHFPSAIQELEIKRIVDYGCGAAEWILALDLSGIEYTGIDIVKPLITSLQQKYTTSTRQFKTGNIFSDAPEYADLWLLRDVCCLYPKSDILQLFQRFLDSKSSFIAVTSVDTQRPYKKSVIGSCIQLNMRLSPFHMPEPLTEIEDGEQWFCKKWLYIYNRQQILEWMQTQTLSSIPNEHGEDLNAHLIHNIPLKHMSIRNHTG